MTTRTLLLLLAALFVCLLQWQRIADLHDLSAVVDALIKRTHPAPLVDLTPYAFELPLINTCVGLRVEGNNVDAVFQWIRDIDERHVDFPPIPPDTICAHYEDVQLVFVEPDFNDWRRTTP